MGEDIGEPPGEGFLVIEVRVAAVLGTTREFLCWAVDAEGRYLRGVRRDTGAPKKGFAARLAGGPGAA